MTIDQFGVCKVVVGRWPWSLKEEQSEYDLILGAAKVECFMDDLLNTGILKDVKHLYYDARIVLNESGIKRRIRELKLQGIKNFTGEETKLLEDLCDAYASQFMLMHYFELAGDGAFNGSNTRECNIPADIPTSERNSIITVERNKAVLTYALCGAGYLVEDTSFGWMDRVASKQELVTDTVAGHSNLSSRKKLFAVLYVGTDSVCVSYFDPVSLEVKSLWPPLNRKYQDKFSIATEIMKFNEEHDLQCLVVGRPWISEKEQRAAPNHFNKFIKEGIEKKEILGYVMSGKEEGEGQSENYLKDEAVKVESVFEDLLRTGILTGIEYTYYDVNVLVNQLMVKKIAERLAIEGDSRFLSIDMTELEVRFAAEFFLMHFMATEVLPHVPAGAQLQGSSCIKQRRNEWSSESLVVDMETKSKEYEFFLDNLGNMRLHWKI